LEVVKAFVGREVVESLDEEGPEALDVAWGCAADQPLEFIEDHFDWVQVRAVGRQVDQCCAGGLDGFTHTADRNAQRGWPSPQCRLAAAWGRVLAEGRRGTVHRLWLRR